MTHLTQNDAVNWDAAKMTQITQNDVLDAKNISNIITHSDWLTKSGTLVWACFMLARVRACFINIIISLEIQHACLHVHAILSLSYSLSLFFLWLVNRVHTPSSAVREREKERKREVEKEGGRERGRERKREGKRESEKEGEREKGMAKLPSLKLKLDRNNF